MSASSEKNEMPVMVKENGGKESGRGELESPELSLAELESDRRLFGCKRPERKWPN